MGCRPGMSLSLCRLSIHVCHWPCPPPPQVGGSGRIRGVSGGERRRVTIGMELVTDPAILILVRALTTLPPAHLSLSLLLKGLQHEGPRAGRNPGSRPRSDPLCLLLLRPPASRMSPPLGWTRSQPSTSCAPSARCERALAALPGEARWPAAGGAGEPPLHQQAPCAGKLGAAVCASAAWHIPPPVLTGPAADTLPAPPPFCFKLTGGGARARSHQLPAPAL